MFFNLKNKNDFTLECLCTKKIFTGNVLKGKNKEKMNVIFDFATFIIVIFFSFCWKTMQLILYESNVKSPTVMALQ